MPTNPRSGYQLPLLLAASFRRLIDRLHVELGAKGHPGVRPIHGFALQALGSDSLTLAELGRRLGVTKQAAAKTVAGLESLGYVERHFSSSDARVRLARATPHGRQLLVDSVAVFDRLRRELIDELGEDRVRATEDVLAHLAGVQPRSELNGLPGWFG